MCCIVVYKCIATTLYYTEFDSQRSVVYNDAYVFDAILETLNARFTYNCTVANGDAYEHC